MNNLITYNNYPNYSTIFTGTNVNRYFLFNFLKNILYRNKSDIRRAF